MNAHLAKVHSMLPAHLRDRTHLFTTFFMSKLLGTDERNLKSSVAELMQGLQYMNVQRCAYIASGHHVSLACPMPMLSSRTSLQRSTQLAHATATQ